MKKTLALLTATFIVLSFMSSCGNTNGDDNKASKTEEPTAEVTTVKETEEETTKAEEVTTKAEEVTTKAEEVTTKEEETTAPEEKKVQNKSALELMEYEIPKASKAPVIDGEISEGEWAGALEVTLTNENTLEKTGSRAVCQGGTFKYLWDGDALYLLAEINDTVLTSEKLKGGAGSYNEKDGIQVCLYLNPSCTASNLGELYFFSLTPKASDGLPHIGEHFIFGTGNAGGEVTDAKIASKVTENGYFIECAFTKDVFKGHKFGENEIKLEEGATLSLANIILDFDGKVQGLFVDTGWFNASQTSKYTLIK